MAVTARLKQIFFEGFIQFSFLGKYPGNVQSTPDIMH